MEKEKETMQITKENLEFVEAELARTRQPLSLQDVTKKLAYKKSSSQMSQEVMMYDPECKYEVGNLIYKEYDEPLMVSSKGMQPFKGAVVLKVVAKIDYKDFNCEMLEVEYSGGGIFRKYIDYMKKTKTQVLLPSNIEGKAKNPEIIDKKEDPRLTALPMTDKDLKTLEKNLKTALSKSPKFFNWDEYWQLSEKQIEIKDKNIDKIKALLEETRLSASTSELVEKLFSVKSGDDLFDIHCMSLTSILEKKYKKDFIYVSPLNWGKWHLKKILQSFSQNLPLYAPKAKIPPSVEETKQEISHQMETPIKVYLGWREILSGGIKIPKHMTREFSHAREYIFTDIEGEKDYTVYYYPSSSTILGLKEFYEAHNVPQGALLTLEKKELNQFNFWLKKSKKKISILKVTYDPKKDVFEQSGEEVFTFSVPNKIIHLERETLKKLFSLFKERKKLELPDLLVMVFKNFGLEGNKCSLHYLRAYHLVDILKNTAPEDVEKALLATSEFYQSEKKAGIFTYKEKIEEKEKPEVPEEIALEALGKERAEEAPAAPSSFEIPGQEIPAPQAEEERREKIQAEAPPPPDEIKIEVEKEAEKPLPPKREKISRKKRMMMEAEKERRARRGAKKFIEEKIELEEFEHEALIARKEKEKKEAKVEKRAAPPKEKKAKPSVSEEPVFGLFAEKLKTALDKKGKEKQEKK